MAKNDFITKDSGKRQRFDSGMVRDTQDGKPRYDLIPVQSLKRLADLYTRGAIKYDDNNWQKGQPYSRAYASLFRHVIAWREGDRSEDHLAAVAWNAFALMWYEENKPELDDLFVEEKGKTVHLPDEYGEITTATSFARITGVNKVTVLDIDDEDTDN